MGKTDVTAGLRNARIRDYLSEAQAQGFVVIRARSGHLNIFTPHHQFVTWTSTSVTDGSRDAAANLLAALRRHGFLWPPRAAVRTTSAP